MKSARFSVAEIDALRWPDETIIPSQHFRLLLAVDALRISNEQIVSFAKDALTKGMIYCCSWGPDCERVHDLVDLVCATSNIFKPPTDQDTVMTTWHENESLEDAVEFFILHALPTPGYSSENTFGLAISVCNKDWGSRIHQQIERLGEQV